MIVLTCEGCLTVLQMSGAGATMATETSAGINIQVIPHTCVGRVVAERLQLKSRLDASETRVLSLEKQLIDCDRAFRDVTAARDFAVSKQWALEHHLADAEQCFRALRYALDGNYLSGAAPDRYAANACALPGHDAGCPRRAKGG